MKPGPPHLAPGPCRGPGRGGADAMNADERDPPTSLESYLRAIERIPLLSRDEERLLVERAFRGGEREAVERLVRGKLRLVVRICRGYRGRGLPFEDLVNEGNLGLLQAAGRFDPRRGNRFLAFAVRSIRHAVVRALERQQMDDAPSPQQSIEAGPEVHVMRAETLDLIRRSVQRLDEPDRYVLMRRFGLQDGEPASLKAIALRLGVTPEMIRLIESRARRRVRSLIALWLCPDRAALPSPPQQRRRLPLQQPEQRAAQRADRS